MPRSCSTSAPAAVAASSRCVPGWRWPDHIDWLRDFEPLSMTAGIEDQCHHEHCWQCC